MGNRLTFFSFCLTLAVFSPALFASFKKSKNGLKGLSEVSKNSDYISSSGEESENESAFGTVAELKPGRNSLVIALDLSQCKSYDENDNTLPPPVRREALRRVWVDGKASPGNEEHPRKSRAVPDISDLKLEDC